jgi:hypothetical protein
VLTKSTTALISSSLQIRALAAQQRAGAGPEEQHVAVAQQFVGPHFVQHDAAVGAAGHLERDPGRQVRFDQAGDHVDGRFLRGQDQVDADRPALLGQRMMCCSTSLPAVIIKSAISSATITMNGRCGNRPLLVGFRLHPVSSVLFAQLVVAADVPHAGAGQQRVALFHLLDGPGQDRFGLAHVGDHRMHQVRQRRSR